MDYGLSTSFRVFFSGTAVELPVKSSTKLLLLVCVFPLIRDSESRSDALSAASGPPLLLILVVESVGADCEC